MTDTEALRRAIDWVKRGVFLAARKEGPAWNPRHGVPGDIVLDAAERWLALAEGDLRDRVASVLIDYRGDDRRDALSWDVATEEADVVLAAITEEGEA